MSEEITFDLDLPPQQQVVHTPEPWCFDSYGMQVTAHGESMLVADIRGYGFLTSSDGPCSDPSDAEKVMAANGQLIAAAPKLLAALQKVIVISDRKHAAWDEAKAAIAEATGLVE